MADIAIHDAADVTDEIIELAHGIVDGWYPEGKIDWTDFLERLERRTLDNGDTIDLGTDWQSPAIRKIQREIREYRRL